MHGGVFKGFLKGIFCFVWKFPMVEWIAQQRRYFYHLLNAENFQVLSKYTFTLYTIVSNPGTRMKIQVYRCCCSERQIVRRQQPTSRWPTISRLIYDQFTKTPPSIGRFGGHFGRLFGDKKQHAFGLWFMII